MIVRGRVTQEDDNSWAKEKAFRRLVFLIAVLVGVILILVAQLFRLQVFGGAPDPELAMLASQETVASRGIILDRNGYFLALNTYEYEITAAPNIITDTQYAIDQLSPLLDLSRDDLAALLDPKNPYALLKKRASKETAEAIAKLKLQGIYLKPKLRRRYPEGQLAAHLLGFVNFDCNGAYGLEGYHDSVLKGMDIPQGGEAYLNYQAIPIAFDPLALPQEGPYLVLTLDRNIQYLVERELAKAVARYQAESGTIIVMDPRTGAILAMASYPSYDPNRFYEVPKEQFDLFVNPAVSKWYEPGSVFKVVTMAAGLETGVVTPDSTYFDSGTIEVGGWTIFNPDRKAHGWVTMRDILAYSLNVGIAHVSTLLGEERFYEYVRRFGFGRKTGIDLDGEIEGYVRMPGSANWSRVDLGTNSFGQGIDVTPLQMITAVAAVANHGLLMKPYVVDRIVDGQNVIVTQPTAVAQVISAQAAEQLTDMLVDAVERGAELAMVPDYEIAGKTGTAQIFIPEEGQYDPELTIASFAGYAPAHDPRFIMLVKIDKPRLDPWGSEVAAPVFRIIAERLFALLDTPSDRVRLASR